MRKVICKFAVFFLVFLLACVCVSRIMNRGHDNLTMEMAPATLPLVTMLMDGVEYNQLHGYYEDREIAFQRDSVTVLGEERDAGFVVDAYGTEVTEAFIEVRSTDGSRLIENTKIKEFQTDKGRLIASFALKDLIERNTEYSLAVRLRLGDGRNAVYYTRVIWGRDLYAAEKLNYVIDFHQRLYDREAARALVQYLESDAKLESNTSFHKVNIHSSFRQITWGNLNVAEVGKPTLCLKEIASQTASLLMNYVVSTSEGKETTFYMVEEYYRVYYTKDAIYLLDYERTMTQVPDESQLCASDKILLGITGTDVDMRESEDGNVVVFEVANRLFSYDVSTNKLIVLFSFYNKENADARSMYAQHSIKILDVHEGGDVQFAVYGYMNRGRHEGEVGIQIYTYDSSRNTVEELLYIPYGKTYAVLAAEMERLLYLNRDQKLYLVLDGAVYGIDLAEKTYSCLLEMRQDEKLWVSENHKVAVWPDGPDIYHSTSFSIRNFANDTQVTLSVPDKKAMRLRPLGFMEEDVIYGTAYASDIVEENSGRTFYPMYKIGICDSSGEQLKEYQQSGIYVTGCAVVDNQITLERLLRLESGEYRETDQDHITNNAEAEVGRNVIVAVDTERYERYVEIQVRKPIDSKTVMILTPKEVVFEGGRQLVLRGDAAEAGYYVYGAYGVEAICYSPARAVNLAYDISGVVVNARGERVWQKGNRVAKNQIMAIQEAAATEEKGTLAVCLDAILAFRGSGGDSQSLLDSGKNVLQILEEGLEDAVVMDLTGCSVDAVLYYVNLDIPVLALLEDGSAVLLVGFNENSVGILDPRKGNIERVSMNRCEELFGANGNQFITYH